MDIYISIDPTVLNFLIISFLLIFDSYRLFLHKVCVEVLFLKYYLLIYSYYHYLIDLYLFQMEIIMMKYILNLNFQK